MGRETKENKERKGRERERAKGRKAEVKGRETERRGGRKRERER